MKLRTYHKETKQLQPEAADTRVVNDSCCQPVPNQSNTTVEQRPQQGLLQVRTTGTEDLDESALEHLVAVE